MARRSARRDDDLTLDESIRFARVCAAQASLRIRCANAQLLRTEALIHRIRVGCESFESVRTESSLWEVKPWPNRLT